MSDPATPGSPARAPSGPGTALDDLCQDLGVLRRYQTDGRTHEAPIDSVLHALRSLGAPVHAETDAADALRAVRHERWQRVVEPVSVSWMGERPAVTVRVMASEAGDLLDIRLVGDEGSTLEKTLVAGDVDWEDEVVLDGRAYRSGRLPLPPDLPPGYHDLSVHVGSREGRTRLVRAPAAAWEPGGETGRGREGTPGRKAGEESRAPASGLPRDWGVFLPLYALRTERGTGIADLGDLRRLAEWTAGRGGSVVGTLPLYAQFLGPGRFEPSPYAPVSRLFWNELYLDLERAPGLEDTPEARRLLASEEVRRAAAELRSQERTDYAAAAALRRPIMEALAAAVDAGGTHGFAGGLERYAQDRPEALAYARFRAFDEAEERPWRDWSGPARAGNIRQGDADPDRVRYHLYAQWAMDEQMAALRSNSSSALYLDLPLGTHADGYDVWRERDLFVEDASGGAPPDFFFQGGQDWGFPPIHPRRSREQGHAYLLRCLRRIMEVSGIIRLDHVMALHRLFWVPAGASAADGLYVRYPAEELYALLCVESHRNRCEVVGEDLGTVPPEVGAAMEERRLRRMWVLPFEVGPDGLREPSPRSVASLGTHDLPPFAAWWRARDVEARAERGQLDVEAVPEEMETRAGWRRDLVRVLAERGLLPGETGHGPATIDPTQEAGGEVATADRKQVAARDVLTPALRLLGRTPARLVLVNLEDLWLEEEPQNEPGTTGSANWTRRARLTLEEIDRDPGVLDALRALDEARADAGTEAPGEARSSDLDA